MVVCAAAPERLGGMGRMTVAAIIPHRAMVLVPPTDTDRGLRGGIASGVWSFVLDAGPDETTRLVMLGLASRPGLAELLFWEPAHFVMERKMMLTIKRLVEEQRSPHTSARLGALMTPAAASLSDGPLTRRIAKASLPARRPRR